MQFPYANDAADDKPHHALYRELRDIAVNVAVRQEQCAAAIALKPQRVQNAFRLLPFRDAFPELFPQLPDGLSAAYASDRNDDSKPPAPFFPLYI